MQFDKLKKFAQAYVDEWDSMTKEEQEVHAKGVLWTLALAAAAIVFTLFVLAMLALIVGKLLPLIIGAALGFGGYILHRKYKS